MTDPASNFPYNIERIMEMLPHRYPFLLIDRIIEIEKNSYIVAVKNVTVNEDFFQGHFPAMRVMPGVLIIEAMAQASAALVVETLGKEAEGKLVYFMAIDDARFRKPVVPGDQLKIHAQKIRNRGNVWKVNCNAYVDDTKAAEALVTAMLLED